jgi:hypothetical protein
MFLGGNIANALNYVLNIVLIRVDEPLFNLYTAYSSLSLILLVPSYVSMRIFTVFGSPVIANIRDVIVRRKNFFLAGTIIAALLLIPLNILLTKVTESGNTITSILLITLACIGFIANIFRGIRQHEENYKRAVVSLNIEALGRVILGFFFAVVLDWGISGILVGHILGLIGSLLVCFDPVHVDKTAEVKDELQLKSIFLNTFVMTAGLEFFSNFDIVYSNYILHQNDQAQTEFNTLQFFRKIIFFGIFTVSSTILSIGSKNRHTNKFMFMFTFATGMLIGIICGVGFFIFKPIIFGVLGQDISLITNAQLALFIGATTLMSTAYLLTNWLFSKKKLLYVFIPVAASLSQAVLFLTAEKALDPLLNAFYMASAIFFIIAISMSIWETLQKKEVMIEE